MLCLGPLGHARQIISVIVQGVYSFHLVAFVLVEKTWYLSKECSSLHLLPVKIHVISLPVLDERIEMIFFGTEDRVKIPHLSSWAIPNTWHCLLPMIKLQVLKQKLKFGKLGLGCNLVEHCRTHMRPWVQTSLLVEGKCRPTGIMLISYSYLKTFLEKWEY